LIDRKQSFLVPTISSVKAESSESKIGIDLTGNSVLVQSGILPPAIATPVMA